MTMRGWTVAALGLAALVAGCADSGRVELDRRLAPLIGIPEAELTRRLQLPPTKVSEVEGTKYLAYYQYWPDLLIMTFRPEYAPPYNAPDLIDRYCEITYAVRGGRVVGYTYQGDACGWGGYPVIGPG
jgi:hypothetical protein